MAVLRVGQRVRHPAGGNRRRAVYAGVVERVKQLVVHLGLIQHEDEQFEIARVCVGHMQSRPFPFFPSV